MRITRCFSAAASLLVMLSSASLTYSQTPIPPVSPPENKAAEMGTVVGATKAAKAGASQVMPATILRVIPGTNTLWLRETDTGTEIVALLDADSRLTKKNAPATLSQFIPEEHVMVRLTMQPSIAPKGDESSYAAERRIRTDISVGKVVTNTASALEVQLTDGGERVHFRVSSKTKFLKDGKETTAAAFPVGATVAVKPRALPTGGIMASMVGESAAILNQMHLDGLITWQGSLASVDRVARQVTLTRDDGASRVVLLTGTTTIHKQRKEAKIEDLVSGDHVKIHLIKGVTPTGFRTADQITVSTTASVPTKKESARTGNSPRFPAQRFAGGYPTSGYGYPYYAVPRVRTYWHYPRPIIVRAVSTRHRVYHVPKLPKLPRKIAPRH